MKKDAFRGSLCGDFGRAASWFPKDEHMLIETFGDEARTYREHTGWLFPMF